MTDYLKQCQAILKEYRDWFFQVANVRSLHIGRVTVGGKPCFHLDGIIVGVTKKVPLSELAPKDRIPRQLGKEKNVTVDVIEVGDIKVLPPTKLQTEEGDDPTARWRPPRPGCSIGHEDITAGTLGCFVRRKSDGQVMILSNAHVLANTNTGHVGDAILQPGPYDGGGGPDMVGRLVDSVPIQFPSNGGGLPPPKCPWARGTAGAANTAARLLGRQTRLQPFEPVPENRVDAAIASIVRGSYDPIVRGSYDPGRLYDYKPIIGVHDAAVGDSVDKTGRTTKKSIGTVLGLDAIVQVNYGEEGVTRFTGQQLLSHMSEPGDSGSVVCSTMYKNIAPAVGLLFAGSDQVTIASPIREVFRLLNLEST